MYANNTVRIQCSSSSAQRHWIRTLNSDSILSLQIREHCETFSRYSFEFAHSSKRWHPEGNLHSNWILILDNPWYFRVYKATFIALCQVFLIILAMQIYLLMYLNKMRANYVLLARSALSEQQEQTMVEDSRINEEFSGYSDTANKTTKTSMEKTETDLRKRTMRKKKPAKLTKLPSDLSKSAEKLVYSLQGSIPPELFSPKTLRKMPSKEREW